MLAASLLSPVLQRETQTAKFVLKFVPSVILSIQVSRRWLTPADVLRDSTSVVRLQNKWFTPDKDFPFLSGFSVQAGSPFGAVFKGGFMTENRDFENFEEDIETDAFTEDDAEDIDSEEEIPEGPRGKGSLHETGESGERKGILVSVYSKSEESEAMASFDELECLFFTAGGVTVGKVTQTRESPNGKTCLGKGKLEELSALCGSTEAELVIFDTELSPVQIREIEKAIETDVSVIDRSMLILDIFAGRATSAEGRLQVELAQLKYTSPRLMGKGRDMSRLGGGVGTRGPGETKLEIDRRRLKDRVHALEMEIKKLENVRMTMRASRDRGTVPKCAIVGYTNAGKSTILNTLTDAGILAEDKLFATLDPTTRQYVLPGGTKVLLTDTVGFIRRLPHHLIKAFKSTLDEAVYADMLMIVADASDPDLAAQMEVTHRTLEELGALGKPTVVVFNKCDRVIDKGVLMGLRAMASDADERSVFISALTGEGIDSLAECLEDMTRSGKKRVVLEIPHSDSGVINTVYRLCDGVEVDYTETGIKASAVCDAKAAGQLAKYIKDYDILFPKTEK